MVAYRQVYGNAVMSDDEQAGEKRPNAKYKLSNPDSKINTEGGLTFHYSRERRLANAPEEVQNLYKEQKKSRFALFGVLVADRPRKILFFMIIFLCVLLLALSALGFFDNSHNLDGNRIEVTGTIYEGNTIISLKKTAVNADAYTGAVDIAVSPITGEAGGQYHVYPHRVFFTLEREERYRFAVPFDSPELGIVLQTEKSASQFTIIPE